MGSVFSRIYLKKLLATTTNFLSTNLCSLLNNKQFFKALMSAEDGKVTG